MRTTARILEVSSFPPPLSGWSVRIQFLKERLEREGHVCTVLNIGPSRRVPSDQYECVLGPVDFVRKLWGFSARGYRVHAHVNGHSVKGLALATVAMVVNRLRGRRPILTFHGGAEQSYFPRLRGSAAAAWAFRAMFALADRIVCNSEAVKAGIVDYGVEPSRITPIPAFSTDYMRFEPEPLPESLEQFRSRWNEFVFTYIRLRAVFHPDVLLDGFARLATMRPGVGFFVCGVGEHAEPEALQAFRLRAERHPLAERLMVVDELPRTQFLSLLGRAHVCVRSPTTDGVSSSVLEALALRVPVVASENGHRPAGVLTYPARDAVTLADTVAHVLDHRPAVVAAIPEITAPDTIADEVRLLAGR